MWLTSNFASVLCSDGLYLDPLSQICTIVPAGFYRPPTNFDLNFYACPSGTYSNIGATACTDCPTNYYSNIGASSCIGPCLPGTFLNGGKCEVVPPGGCYFGSIRLAIKSIATDH